MSQLTKEMKEMVESQQCFHARVSKDGIPNNAPKRSKRVFDDNTLIFTEGTAGTTYRNILDGSRFLGTPEILSDGDIYDKTAEISIQAGMPKP